MEYYIQYKYNKSMWEWLCHFNIVEFIRCDELVPIIFWNKKQAIRGLNQGNNQGYNC